MRFLFSVFYFFRLSVGLSDYDDVINLYITVMWLKCASSVRPKAPKYLPKKTADHVCVLAQRHIRTTWWYKAMLFRLLRLYLYIFFLTNMPSFSSPCQKALDTKLKYFQNILTSLSVTKRKAEIFHINQVTFTLSVDGFKKPQSLKWAQISESLHTTPTERASTSQSYMRETLVKTLVVQRLKHSVWKEWVQHEAKESPYCSVQTEQWVVNIY